ncbi:MAG: hypothetical protein JWQ25_3149 [Daejeonella sp.]|nr:hypothetical protein [Daejeonella sp.]
METNHNNLGGNKSSLSQPGSVPQEEIKYREEPGNVREGARHEDQLEELHPGDDEDRKSHNKQVGAQPFTEVNDGSQANENGENTSLDTSNGLSA